MIRQGLKNGQRPTAALLHDPYAGHRDWDDPFWIPDPVLHTQWTDWDFALAEAVTALDSLSSQSGQPRWLAEDPDVYWDVITTVDYSIQQLAEEQRQYKEGVPPEISHYLHNPHKTTGEFWTMEEWLDWREENRDRAPILDRNAPDGARPPTADELVAMQKAREERLARLYAEADEADSVD